jgi:hypothetical protein
MNENPFTTEMIAFAKRDELDRRLTRQHVEQLIAEERQRPGVRAAIASALLRIARAVDGATVGDLTPRPTP